MTSAPRGMRSGLDAGRTRSRKSRSLLPSLRDPADLRALDAKVLPRVAQELRERICEQVGRSGGHLAPNLGAVELTVALHYVFDFRRDRLLFDVGHQCYPHKLLTGRGEAFRQLRQRGGAAGFPEPSESPYDLFSVGHAGTGISTAVGMARADGLLGEGDRRVVTLVGDASIVNGVALEGLNNAGTLKRQFLVVLNDNGMSIAKPQGALARAFAGITLPSRGRNGVHGLAEIVDHPFARFGLRCLGPVDGHDLSALLAALREARELDRPVLLHCKTVKGKGFDFSSGDPTTFHSPRPFEVIGCRVEVKKGRRSYTAAFGEALGKLMERDSKVFTVTAAMPDGTGTAGLLERYPERSLDTGICESHAMDMCAGMARAGLKPFFAVYSTFAQRALDQVFQEVALQGLPVRVCMDRAGYVGGDGAVHHGFLDIALFKPFPGAVLLAASDEPSLRAALEFMRTHDESASFLRFPRDEVPARPLAEVVPPFVPGRAHRVHASVGKKAQVSVLAYGAEVYPAVEAARRLEAERFDVEVYDARFAKPLDVALLRRLVRQGIPLLTVEDHSTTGGFGAAVLEALNDERLPSERVWRLGMPERWSAQASRATQLSEAGLDADGIERRLRQILSELAISARSPRPLLAATPLRGGRRVGT